MSAETKLPEFDLNEYFKANRKDSYPPMPRIHCADGFNISVQAGKYLYCTPREDEGPWCDVECGYPSEAAEELMRWADDRENPTQTVYGYVPVHIIEALVQRHGGLATT